MGVDAVPARGRWNVLALAVALLLAACNGDSVSGGSLAETRSRVEKGEFGPALIPLKSILQSDPSNTEARYLLGVALNGMDQGALAEIELRKVLESGYDKDKVVPALARAMLQARRHAKLLEEFSKVRLSAPASQNVLDTMLADATGRAGKLSAARDKVQEVLDRDANFGPALLLKSRIMAGLGDLPAGAKLADSLVEREPKNVDALLLAGDYRSHFLNDRPGALALFDRALALQPDNLHALSSAFTIQIDQRAIDSARKYQQALQKVRPGHPQTKYVEAQLALAEGKTARARELAQQLVGAAPEHIGVLHLAGMVELSVGSVKRAEALLAKALQLAPQHNGIRVLLAETYQRSGQQDRAATMLAPLLSQDAPDVRALTLAAEIALQRGDLARADSLYQRALKAKPADSKLRTAQAVLTIAKGNVEDGQRDLRALSASDQGNTAADYSLITSQLMRRDYAAAQESLRVLERKQPKDAGPELLRGRVYLAQSDRINARKSLEAAVAKEPGSFAAVAAIATLDVTEGDLATAQARYETLLKSQPAASVASMAHRALAGIKHSAGAPKADIVAEARAAVKADRNSVPAWVTLVDALLYSRDAKSAVTTAQEALAALPDVPELVEAHGRAQLAANDTNQALVAFNRLALLAPNLVLAHVRLAQTHQALKNDAQTLASLRRALEIEPDNSEAQRMLVAQAVHKGGKTQALDIARGLQSRFPRSSMGFRLEGEVLASLREYPAAIAAFQRGLDKSDVGRLPIRIQQAYLAAEQPAEAQRFVDAWLKSHPDDAAFQKHLADQAMSRKDHATAERYYDTVVRLTPFDMMSLNNLAWLKAQAGKPSVALAERAVSLAPRTPAVLDTLAHAQLAEKRNAEAVATAKRMLTAAPGKPMFQLSAAKVFLAAGEHGLARAELDKLEKLDNPAIKTEAAKLREKLPAS